MSTNEENDEAVRATNNDAFESKLAALRKGYYDDEHLAALGEYFGPDLNAQRPPVINRGTAGRVHVKNGLVSAFLSTLLANGHENVQVVSLGAGFDTLPFRLMKEGMKGRSANLHIVELDFTEVVSSKVRAVRDIAALRVLFGELHHDGDKLKGLRRHGDGTRTSYGLRACDLRNKPLLQRTLRESGLKPEYPTIVLAEITLIYMEPSVADTVLGTIADFFPTKSAIICIEHITPDDPFGREMVRNISARGSPLSGINAYPTLPSQTERFIKAGWPNVRVMTMLDAFKRLFSPDEAIRLNRIEFLDETEEWSMLMQHYCVAVAVADVGGQGRQMLDDALRIAFDRATR